MKKIFPYIVILLAFIVFPGILLGCIYLLAVVLAVLKYLFSGFVGGLLIAFIPIFFILLILFVVNLFTDEK